MTLKHIRTDAHTWIDVWMVVGDCGWLWVVVDGRGWLWMVEAGCGWL